MPTRWIAALTFATSIVLAAASVDAHSPSYGGGGCTTVSGAIYCAPAYSIVSAPEPVALLAVGVGLLAAYALRRKK